MRIFSPPSLLAGAIGLTLKFKRKRNLVHLALFLAVLAAAGTAFLLRDSLTFAQAGYAGVAIAALIASGGLVVPIPALATACTAGALLNPWVVALIAGAAEGLGELTGYFLGYSGQGVVVRVLNHGSLYHRLEGWMRRRGWLALLLVSLVPNPVFDFVGIAAGALHYPVWRFLAVVWTGKILKFGGIAYGCTYGFAWLTGLF